MSSNNDDMNGAGGMGMLGAGAIILVVIFYAALTFVAFFMTILALCAVFADGLKLWKWRIDDRDALHFLLRGAAGAVSVPMFATYCAHLFEFNITSEWYYYLWTGGYSAGAVLCGQLIRKYEPEPFEFPTTPPAPLPAFKPTSKPFTYASWSDEREDA
jgi:hypothetical protein